MRMNDNERREIAHQLDMKWEHLLPYFVRTGAKLEMRNGFEEIAREPVLDHTDEWVQGLFNNYNYYCGHVDQLNRLGARVRRDDAGKHSVDWVYAKKEASNG